MQIVRNYYSKMFFTLSMFLLSTPIFGAESSKMIGSAIDSNAVKMGISIICTLAGLYLFISKVLAPLLSETGGKVLDLVFPLILSGVLFFSATKPELITKLLKDMLA